MGVADRGYMRGRAPTPVSLGASWTLRFLVLLGVVFLVVNGGRGWFHRDVEGALVLSRTSIEEGRVWTLLTSALAHREPMHLLFNAIGIWFFGKLVEETVGGGRYVAFLVLAAVLSHIPFLVAEFVTGDTIPTIGASGIVMAAIVFAAFRYPSLPVTLIILPMRLWQMAALYVVLDLFGAFGAAGGTDHWTHLGGAAYGFLAHQVGIVPSLRLRRRPKVLAREAGPYRDGNASGEVDRILDKINAEGIGSLSDAEREFLRRNSGRYH